MYTISSHECGLYGDVSWQYDGPDKSWNKEPEIFQLFWSEPLTLLLPLP